ncbi:MAG: glutamate-1-semialdehyde 2,1-aminomutase [Steroidobacteraceae bacterium]
MSRSDELFARAKQVSPGGVHSPVRAFKGVGGTPRFMTGGAGPHIHDVDGRELVDYCMAFGPLILGHGNAAVREAAKAAIDRGWSLGTAEHYSLALAEFITRRVPWVQSIRFVNSGTEAVMSALRLARGVTGRDKILKFDGCYHGHTDAMLIRSGSGLAETAEPDSAGLDRATLGGTLVAPLDDEAALEKLFAAHGREIACAIIEPLPANYGLLPQRREYLATLAALCRKHGALLVFDEVISGFRVGFQGCAGLYGFEPDLVTYGKVIGGGFPVGAYGGRREYMEKIAPAGPVYQAGTLSANPVAMCAGLATLEQLEDGRVYAQLEQLGARLEQGLAGLPGLTLQRVGSVFWPLLATTSSPVRSLAQLRSANAAPFGPVFHRLLDHGIYLAPSAFEVGFLSAAHTAAHVDQLIRELHEALATD